jgi:hypothetical protein
MKKEARLHKPEQFALVIMTLYQKTIIGFKIKANQLEYSRSYFSQ